MNEQIKIVTLYASNPSSYRHLTERLEQRGNLITHSLIPDKFTLDPSIIKSGSANLWQGEKNLVMFVINEERKALN